MTEEMEEQKWLESVQKKLKKYILSPYWDSISLSDVYMGIINLIMQAKNVKELSPLINERITDQILNKIATEIQKAKRDAKTK